MKKSLSAFLMLLFICTAPYIVSVCHAADAVVDYAEIIRQSPGCEEALAQYNRAVAKEKAKFEEKLSAAQNEAEKAALKEDYARFCEEQRRIVFGGVLSRIKEILRQIGQEKGYAAIYDKGAGKGGTDITQEAISMINRQKPVSGGTLAVAPAVRASEDKAVVRQNKAAAKTPQYMPSSNMEVQFGAGNNREAIDVLVARAKKNGIETAYTAQTQDKNGKTLYRARATAESAAEARAIAAKLTHMGLKNFIVK